MDFVVGSEFDWEPAKLKKNGAGVAGKRGFGDDLNKGKQLRSLYY